MKQVSSFEDLDPSVKEQLDLKTFQVTQFIGTQNTAQCTQTVRICFCYAKFDAKDFIGSISEKLISNSKADSGRMFCE